MAEIVKPCEVLTKLFLRAVDEKKARNVATEAIAALVEAGWSFEHKSLPGRTVTYLVDRDPLPPPAEGEPS